MLWMQRMVGSIRNIIRDTVSCLLLNPPRGPERSVLSARTVAVQDLEATVIQITSYLRTNWRGQEVLWQEATALPKHGVIVSF